MKVWTSLLLLSLFGLLVALFFPQAQRAALVFRRTQSRHRVRALRHTNRSLTLREIIGEQTKLARKSFSPLYKRLFPVQEESLESLDLETVRRDFHSHWNGVLWADDLYDVYAGCDRMSLREWEFTFLVEELRMSWEDERDCRKAKWDTRPAFFLRLATSVILHNGEPSENGTMLGESRGRGAVRNSLAYLLWLGFSVPGCVPDLHPTVNFTYSDLRDFVLGVSARLYISYAKGTTKAWRTTEIRKTAEFGLESILRAGSVLLFDDAYVVRKSLRRHILKSEAYRVDVETYRFLQNIEEIRYAQMSIRGDKVVGIEDAFKKERGSLIVHWLALVARHHEFLESDCDDLSSCEVVFNASALKGELDQALPQVRDIGTIVGLDLAGPEIRAFKKQPASYLMRYILNELARIGRSKTVLFRPHVGEGALSVLVANSLVFGDASRFFVSRVLSFFRMAHDESDHPYLDKSGGNLIVALLGRTFFRDYLNSYRASVKRAENNLDVFLGAIASYRDDPNTTYPIPGVQIRFGHSVCAKLRHITMMKELGVAVDVNLESNLRTGALGLPSAENLFTYTDLAGDEFFDLLKFEEDVWGSDELLVDLLKSSHPLRRFARAQVEVVLGTDGQGVEMSSWYRGFKLGYDLFGEKKEKIYRRIVNTPVRVGW